MKIAEDFLAMVCWRSVAAWLGAIGLLTALMVGMISAANAQNNNPDLTNWAPTATAIVTYKAGSAPPPTIEVPTGWNSQVQWKFRTVAGQDQWLWPVSTRALCDSLVDPNPEDNVFTRNQKGYDNMLAAMSGTSDPNNIYTTACADGAP